MLHVGQEFGSAAAWTPVATAHITDRPKITEDSIGEFRCHFVSLVASP